MFKCSSNNCNCHIFHKETLEKVSQELINDEKVNDIVEFMKIFSNYTRVKILEAIKDDELCVCDLGHLLGVTKSAISHQMKEIKKYNLVTERKEGKMVYYKLKNKFVSNLISNVKNELEEGALLWEKP